MNPVLELEPDDLVRSFDRRPFLCRHRLAGDEAFSIPALVDLARQLPDACVEYQAGDVPVHLDPNAAPRTGLSLVETLENIESCASWVVLKHVEQVPAYRELMERALGDVAAAHPSLEPSSLLQPAAFVFVSSAASVTPYHVDPELNFLLQIRGRKTMYVWPASDRDALPEEALESFHAGSHRNLAYRDDLQERAARCDLDPGVALHVPVTAPHWVRNGEDVSVSLSVTFRTPESNRREILYRINAHLRRMKLRPRPPGVSPGTDRLKLAAFSGLRRARRIVARGGGDRGISPAAPSAAAAAENG